MTTSWNQTLTLGAGPVQPDLLQNKLFYVEISAKNRQDYLSGHEDNVNVFTVAALDENEAITQIKTWYSGWSESAIVPPQIAPKRWSSHTHMAESAK